MFCTQKIEIDTFQSCSDILFFSYYCLELPKPPKDKDSCCIHVAYTPTVYKTGIWDGGVCMLYLSNIYGYVLLFESKLLMSARK